uniref:dynein light chain Tctex-type protein 2B isoform X1 n=2 Tax=Oncorhynchus gorbuscha TaxID=8017 RepID=UPI001EAEBD4B|nr:dynein light chain Tctex-type protein 2B isoform X1 [Oncorhynchus gorbuscha]
MEGTDTGGNTYLIRPNYHHKFKAAVVKECIHDVLREQLSGVQYDPDEVGVLSRSLADCIKDKLKDVGFDRYKLVVQVVIGEQRGEGVKMAARCFWDADTDSYAQDIFMNFTRENDREDEEDVELKIIWMRIAILVSCSWTLKTI